MDDLSASTGGVDPYRSFRYRVKWNGKYVAGVSRVSMPERGTQADTGRGGGDPATPRGSPGQGRLDPIVLERGVTHDPAFAQWANQVWDWRNDPPPDQGTSLPVFRKDLVIELYDEAGQKVTAYDVYRCWPSSLIALPEPGGDGVVAIQSMTLENEGWERDASVAEP